MRGALRLQAVTLPVGDLEAAGRFWRWSFRLEPEAGPEGEGALVLGWGGSEDRLRLVAAGGAAVAEDALALRMPSAGLEEAVTWCREQHLELLDVRTSPEDRGAASALAGETPVSAFAEPEAGNLTRIAVRVPSGGRLDLVFPLPAEVVAARGRLERFWWRSSDWSGLRTPGLLGITWGSPDVAAARTFFEKLGPAPLDAAGEGPSPLRVGDQQILVEERERAGIHGVALVVPLAKLPEVKRTLEHLEAPVRESGNRILTRDPHGRLVFVQGVRAA